MTTVDLTSWNARFGIALGKLMREGGRDLVWLDPSRGENVVGYADRDGITKELTLDPEYMGRGDPEAAAAEAFRSI